MRRVMIQKVILDEEGSFVPLGRPIEGWEDIKPTVGEQYFIFGESFIFKTSIIVTVHDHYFETQNSTYRIRVLEEEPFDLSGEEDPRKTQEMLIKKGTFKKR